MDNAIKHLFGALLCSVLASCACKEDVIGVAVLETKPGIHAIDVSDQTLAQAFSKQPFSGDGYVVHWYEHSIEIMSFAGLNVPGVVDTLAQYQSVDSSRDAIAAQFIRVAQERGQSVKLYNAKANAAIVGCVRQRPVSSGGVRADLDPTLVAFDRQGNLTAALVRIHRFDQHLVTQQHFVISKIYFGSLARDIELQLGGTKKLRPQLIRSI